MIIKIKLQAEIADQSYTSTRIINLKKIQDMSINISPDEIVLTLQYDGSQEVETLKFIDNIPDYIDYKTGLKIVQIIEDWYKSQHVIEIMAGQNEN